MYKYFIITLFYFSSAFTAYNSFNQPFIDVAKNQTSTIVSIISEKTTKVQNPFQFNPFGFEFEDDPFNQEFQSQSLGSGVIIDNLNGYIITNNHVIDGAEDIQVILADDREFDATIIGTDPLSDLAIVQIEAKDLSKAKLGNSDDLQIAEWVIAIGSPFGLHLDHTVTAGIISAVGRSDVISRMNYENFIQHDAAINPGNSGGGLFNLSGELIGINTAIATDGYSKSNAGVGFAVPINQVKYVIEYLINEGKVIRGWLGVQIRDLDEDMAKVLGLDSKKGAMIAMVSPNSPAKDAGIEDKDVIIAMNYESISDSNELKNKVSMHKPGTVITFTIIRNNSKINIDVTLGARPDQDQMVDYFSGIDSAYDLLGFKVDNIEDQLGVQILDIDNKSNAYKKGIKKSDVITEIGNEKINNKDDYLSILSNYKSGDAIMLRVISKGTPRYEAFEIE